MLKSIISFIILSIISLGILQGCSNNHKKQQTEAEKIAQQLDDR